MRKIAYIIAGLTAAAVVAAGFILVYSPAAATPVDPEPTPAPIVEITPELPDWAKGTTWLVYPEGFQCVGTEGCPNDYRTISEPGPVLPEGVVPYDPAKHDCVIVQPVGVTC